MPTIRSAEPAPGLSRAELWAGLVRKAEDPLPFVPAISECRVLARGPGWLVREAVVRGERLRERVTFHPTERVRFERLSGRARGTIENRIVPDASGGLLLAFTFELEVEGLAPGSAEERAWVDVMQASYREAVLQTLRATAALVAPRGDAA